MVAAFQEQTGIPTTYQRMSSGESLVRLQAGAAAPEFDVWWGGPADGQIAAGLKGLVEPYISPNAAAIAEGQKAEDGTWTGVYVGALEFCSDTELLDELGVEAPDSWEDLLDPRLEDNKRSRTRRAPVPRTPRSTRRSPGSRQRGRRHGLHEQAA